MSAQPLSVEVDTGSATSWGRPPDRAWLVRLRRADASVILAIGLSRTGADHLAERIAELVGPDPAGTHATNPAGPTSKTRHLTKKDLLLFPGVVPAPLDAGAMGVGPGRTLPRHGSLAPSVAEGSPSSPMPGATGPPAG